MANEFLLTGLWIREETYGQHVQGTLVASYSAHPDLCDLTLPESTGIGGWAVPML